MNFVGNELISTHDIVSKDAEDALLKTGTLQNAIFNSANFSSIATDEKGVIQIFNVGAERMLGYTAAEVMNKNTPADISDPQEVIARAAALSVELATPITPGFESLVFKAARGIEDIYELTYIRKDGSRFPAIVSVTALRDAQGGIIGYLLIGADNTARKQKQIEERIGASFKEVSDFKAALDEHAIVAFTDPRGKITHVNDKFCAISKYSRDELLGQDHRIINSGHHSKEFFHEMWTTITHGRTWKGELRNSAKDGSAYWVDTTIVPFLDAEGKPYQYVAIRTDITARKQAEEVLLKTGALQSAIFNSANFSSIATDAKGVIQIFNVGAERMLGYTAAEVMNKITPADISDPQEVIARAKSLSVELGTPITPGFEALVFKASRGIEDIYELTYIRKDGSRFPAVVSVTALRDAQDAIIGYLLIGTDNTARKQVEAERMLLDQAVRDQQFYTRSLIESNIDALMTTDPRGIITDVNKQMEALTGCTRDELIGAPFKDYFTDPERAEAGIKLMLGEGKVTDYELTARARDGKETVVSYNATTFHDRHRKLRGVFAAARDVTERKRYEHSLQEADRRKNEFLAMLAHELRNPLAPMRNALQIMRLKASREVPRPEDEAIQSASAMMERQVGQMVRLVDDLLDVSRISSGKIELRRERIELLSAIYHAVEAARSQYQSMGHELTVTLPPKPIFLNADPTRLAQVLGNLLNNACKYTYKDGKMCLTVEREGNQAVIRLRDNGIGIAADQLPRIFEMFVQIDTSLERSVSGLGIGLMLVKSLVEMHDGTVEAHSAGVGQGSEFVVRLPIMVQPPESPPPAPTVSKPVTTITRRILVVDDNQDSATSLAALLDLTGHKTHIAYDGLEAVEAAATFLPDVVLLDIGLPKLNGYDACRKIREQPSGKGIVLIALTGWGQDEDRCKSQAAGFDAHLVKPVDYDTLTKLLAELRPTRA
ncbi:MAG: PAS domain S-box protein [Planctomycetaceae bacterium]